MATTASRPRLSASARRWPWILWVLLALLYTPTLAHLVTRWWITAAEDVTVVIPFLVALLVWQRRAVLRAGPWRGSLWGWPLLGLGLLALTVGVARDALTAVRASLLLSVAGVVLLQGGLPLVRVLAVPLSLLVFLVPSRTFFYRPAAALLQAVSAWGTTGILQILHVPVTRDGFMLHLSRATLVITEGCSGIRSLSALSVVAVALVATVPFAPRARWLLLIGAPTLAVVANVLRIVAIAAIVEATGVSADLAHVVSNWITFALALMILTVVARRLAGPAPRASLGD